ncbi:hypothetical protein BT93_E0487 [Corymbia citriodora subsp. variegata]|nr:hypothetical protein BT93_E0487 [Corymbia citriodora subsp. variegata]
MLTSCEIHFETLRPLNRISQFLTNLTLKSNLQMTSETTDSFEKQLVNSEVQAEYMESAVAGSTSLSTTSEEVNSLMQQLARNR